MSDASREGTGTCQIPAEEGEGEEAEGDQGELEKEKMEILSIWGLDPMS